MWCTTNYNLVLGTPTPAATPAPIAALPICYHPRNHYDSTDEPSASSSSSSSSPSPEGTGVQDVLGAGVTGQSTFKLFTLVRASHDSPLVLLQY